MNTPPDTRKPDNAAPSDGSLHPGPAADAKPLRLARIAPLVLRWALGLTLLSAVADRFGWWGPPGGPNVSWGDWAHFVAYTAKVNGFLPSSLAPGLALLATAAEVLLGVALLLRWFPRVVAGATCLLLASFAAAMVLSFGIKAPLNFSVFVDAAAALLLWAMPATLGTRQSPAGVTDERVTPPSHNQLRNLP